MESKIFTYTNNSDLPGTDGPMAGISMAVDPGISIADWPSNDQCLALENYVALEDATLISRLRKSGAFIAGRTSAAELGLGLDEDRWTEAVKSGYLVLKTDTIGEARMAGALSNCFGFKPSYGLISRFGMISMIPSMETCGLVSNSLENISKAVYAMAGLDDRDPTMDESGIQRALSLFNDSDQRKDNPFNLGRIKECNNGRQGSKENPGNSFEKALERFARADIQVKDVSVRDFSLAKKVHNIIGIVEASSSAGRFDSVRYGHRTGEGVKNWNQMYIKSRNESFGPLVKAYLFQGGYFQYKNYPAFLDAARIRARLIENLERAFEDVDFLVVPVSEKTLSSWEKPGTISELYDGFSMTLLASLTGNPSIFVPKACNDTKNRAGVQVIGKRFEDARLLAAASRISDIYTGEAQ